MCQWDFSNQIRNLSQKCQVGKIKIFEITSKINKFEFLNSLKKNRILKEQGHIKNLLFGFVSLKSEDQPLIDNIITDLNKKPFPGKKEQTKNLNWK